MPRADTMPSFTTDISQVLTPTNRLGVRGAGEGGTTGALGAVVNSVVDALAEFGVTHIEMPITPEKIWRAIHAARNNLLHQREVNMADILTKQDGRDFEHHPQSAGRAAMRFPTRWSRTLTGIIASAEKNVQHRRAARRRR